MVELINCENSNSYVIVITGFLPSCCGSILTFISRVVAFLLFSPEAEDTDGHFVDMVGCKTENNIPKLLAAL
jgi:hypothetical protein